MKLVNVKTGKEVKKGNRVTSPKNSGLSNYLLKQRWYYDEAQSLNEVVVTEAGGGGLFEVVKPGDVGLKFVKDTSRMLSDYINDYDFQYSFN